MKNERASEAGEELDLPDEMGPRKVYAPPRLTRWGAIAKATRADDDAGSGIPL